MVEESNNELKRKRKGKRRVKITPTHDSPQQIPWTMIHGGDWLERTTH